MTIEQGVGMIVIDRPDRSNALDVASWRELGAVFRSLEDDPSCRVVVLTGEGSTFCAGIDLADRVAVDVPAVIADVQDRVELYVDVIELIGRLRYPVIAAVNGPAVGAGVALACACDVRLLGSDARLDVPFTRFGLSGADLGLTWTLPRLIGPDAAARLLLTGGSLSAIEAGNLGLGSVSAEPLLDEAIALARGIADQPAFGVRTTKALLAESLAAGGLGSHLRAEARAQILCALTDEHRRARA